MIHQVGFVPKADFNLTVFLGGMFMIGVPGVGAILAARSGTPTNGQPSSRQPADSLPDSAPSSLRGLDGSDEQ
jgi:hypothetical protein